MRYSLLQFAPLASTLIGMRSLRLLVLVPVLAVIFFGLLTNHAFAFFYTADTNGYDISYPQGNGPYPAIPFDFGIVGVTNGRAFTDNPYLSQQFIWATQGTFATPSLYMNLNAPVGSTVKGNTSIPKSCNKNDKICQAYNYGYNAAAHAYFYAKSQGASASVWWLDIETGNSWSSTKAINASTIQGSIDYFNSSLYSGNPSATVGIYSTPSMWSAIVGDAFTTPVPNWIGGNNANPSSLCTHPFTQNGVVYLIQYSSGNFDADYSCQ